jgi:hypothetical protein
MTDRKIFGLVTRLVGGYVALYGMHQAWIGIALLIHLYPSTGAEGYTTTAYFLTAGSFYSRITADERGMACEIRIRAKILVKTAHYRAKGHWLHLSLADREWRLLKSEAASFR